MERKLTAVLVADVVGYSRLVGKDETGTLSMLNSHRNELIDPEIIRRGGRIVKTTGDGLLVQFPSIVAAVECAAAIQQGMTDRNRNIPVDRRMELRIGVNVDEVVVDGDDIHGDGVNVAARLEQFAEPGTVYVSGLVHAQVKNRVDIPFEDLGRHRFKNIAEPVHVFRFKLPGTTSSRADPVLAGEDLPLPQRPSIAILPFANLSGDPEQDYLADGLRLDIQAALVHASGLFLIAPGAINKYRNTDVSAEQVGRETGVRFVLQGAVRRSARRIRITVELSDVAARRIVWAERYDRVLDDSFMVQDEITAEVLKALDVKLASGEKWLLHSAMEKLDALDAFYRGLSHFYAGSRDDNAKAREMFEMVARLEPDSPVGPAFLCFTHWVDVFRGWADSKERSLEQAVSLANEAVRFKGNNGLPHMVLASVHLMNRRHDEALASCVEAAGLRPNCPTATIYLANVLHYCGRSSEAIAKIHEAIRLSPVYPPWYMTLLAAAYRDKGDIEKSMATALHGIDLNPRDRDIRLVLCTDYVFAGKRQEAQRTAQDILTLDPAFSIASYVETQPYRNKQTLRRMINSLREAGLPD